MAETPRVTSSEGASGAWLDTIGWGLLLIWVGMVFLLRWGWGPGLAGAGAIVLGAQAWRRHLGLKWDRFGVLCGVLLLVSGAWTLLNVAVALVPLLCIAAGIALVVSTWTAHRSHAHASSHPR